MKEFTCPYCGSRNQFGEDVGQRSHLEVVVDCEICCRPIIVCVRVSEFGYEIDARAENN